jgi:beta-lactamase regulating signal transducer with metallopeptidase domain
MSAFAEAIRPATDACWTYLFYASWQAAVVGLLILAVVATGRRMSAPLRYGLLMLALVKFVVPPFAAMPFGVISRFTPALGATATVGSPERPASVANLPTDPLSKNKTIGVVSAQFPKNSAATRSPIPRNAPPVVTAAPSKSPTPATRVAEAPAVRVAAPIAPIEPDARPSVMEGSALPQIPEVAARGLDFQQIAVFAWIAGLCLVVAWLFQQRWRLRQILRSSTLVETAVLQTRMRLWVARLGLKRVPELRQLPSGTVPFSCGLFAPKVVVPALLFEQLTSNQIDVVLSHELAHHRRRDLWVNALQIVVFVFFWFHPVVWILNRAIRRIREDCCDDMLLANRLITREDCCETLLAVARAQVARPSLVWGVSMGHPLGTRLVRLMDEAQVRRFRLSRRGWLCLAAIGALLWPGLRMTAAAQNANEAVRPTADTSQEEPRSPDAGGVNTRQTSATKSSTPAAVQYTTFATRLDGKRFDQVTREKRVDANGRSFDLYRATVSFGPVQRDDLGKSPFVAWQFDLVESSSFSLPWVRDLAAPRRLIVVTATGYGPAFCDLTKEAPRDEPRRFYFPKDDVPIRGQIVSAHGKPLGGVTVAPRILQYFETPDGKPVALDAAAPLVDAQARSREVTRSGLEIASLFPAATTDSAGRFEIRGIGRERVVRLLISGPGIESHWISVATRSSPIEFQDVRSKKRLFAVYRPESKYGPARASLSFGMYLMEGSAWCDEVLPATFVQPVAPSRPIVGIVCDDRSGQPLRNVRVSNEPPLPSQFMNWPPKHGRPEVRGEVRIVATTNQRGEFELSGVPERTNVILAEPPDSQPFFNRGVLCDTRGEGGEPVKLVIRLARGIPVHGRLFDQNGKPMAGRINYFPLRNNGIIGAYLDSISVGRTGEPLAPQFPEALADHDGHFFIPVLPGPGVLLADHREGVLRRYSIPGFGPAVFVGDRQPVSTRAVRFDRPEDREYANYYPIVREDDPTVVPTFPRPLILNPYDAYKAIDLPAEVASRGANVRPGRRIRVTQSVQDHGSDQVELRVNFGHSVEGHVVDPAGKPLAGVVAYGTSHERLGADAEFDTRGLVPGGPRLLYFLQAEKGLGGFCRVEDGQPGPITVGLEPTGTIRGSLADAKGKPLAHARFYLAYAEADGVPRVIFPGGWRIPTADEYDRARWMGVAAPPADHRWETTDDDGAFLVRGVIPRLAFQLFASAGQYSTDPLAVTRVLPNRNLDLGTLKLPVVR